LVYVCFPAEKKRGYSLAFRALKSELVHWALPMVGQLCYDYAVLEMYGIHAFWGSQLPRVEEGAAALRRMPSSSSSASSNMNSSDTPSEDAQPLVRPPALPASAAHA
jgi:hypothetical protein